MKKILAILLAAVLVSAIFAIPVSALYWAEGDYTLAENGNVNANHAWGYSFRIDSVNGKIAGEKSTIITTEEAYMNANSNWAAHALLAPTSDPNVYEVVHTIAYSGGADKGLAAGINFTDGKICMLIHSSASYAVYEDDGVTVKYPNWEQKVACLALANTIGAKITLSGIDLAAGTCENGAAIVEKNPAEQAPTGPVITEDKNLSVGKTYTTTAPNRNDTYDDDGKKLTDGVKADAETAGNTDIISAWNNLGKAEQIPNVVEVIIDLEEAVLSNSYTIFVAGGTWGISAPTSAGSPTSFEVFAADSADGEYTSVVTAPVEDVTLVDGTGESGTWSTYSLTAKAATPVEARFIKFVITVQPVGNAFVWASEVEVNAVKTGDSTTTTVKEEITVDGDLSDNGWNAENWTEVTPDNGYWQALPTTDTLSYKYQLRTDDTKLYAAFEIDC
ncbi:MAG: hypothetical protein IKY21_06520, partial [Clostridia bacterium]|nr:hypothetical protein [Clostridia bacterium]